MVPFVASHNPLENSRTITYKVHGFWSTRYITVWQNRRLLTGEWREPEISWSCGGRDVAEEPSDAVAASCFSQALTHAVECAGSMK